MRRDDALLLAVQCVERVMEQLFYVYILTNAHHNVFYIGVTNDLMRRTYEHKNKLVKGFSYKYNIDKLVYYECFGSIELAILREKLIKKWRRDIKCEAINAMNPDWHDMYEAFVAGDPVIRWDDALTQPLACGEAI